MKNLIFDLGGVIIDIDPSRTISAFEQLGVTQFFELYADIKQEHFLEEFDKGNFTDDDFRNKIRSYLPGKVTDEQIDSAWNALLIGVPVVRFEWLKELGKKHRIFVLSNTNQIHVKAFSKILEHQYGPGKFEALFEKIYLSCDLGMRKPQPEIFDLVVRENQLPLAETVFIDDTLKHVEAARARGLNAFLLEKGVPLEKFFPTLPILATNI